MRFYRWLLRLLPASFRQRRGDDLLDAATDQLEAAASAGRAAQLRTGAGLAADVVKIAWSLRWQAFMTGVGRDVRYALRGLRRSPGFTLVAILTLGIGIGANTTVFSLVNAFYFARAEFPDEEHLVTVGETSVTQLCAGCGVGTSYPGFVEWRDRAQSFDRLSAYIEERVVLSGPLTPQRLSAARATATLFPVLGIQPVVGRSFRVKDDLQDAAATVILGHAAWRRLFGGDPSAIGRTVRVNGRPTEIIGVMPAGFAFPAFAEAWLPLHAGPLSDDRSERELGVIGRLRPGTTLAQANVEMRTIAAAQEQAYPATQKEWSAAVHTLREDRQAEGGPPFVTMLGAVALVLGVACTNLAALVLARAGRRQREISVRASLGASRARLAGQLVAESLVLGLLGGGVGMLLSLWGVAIARAQLSEPVPYFIRVDVDWRVLAFCMATAIITGLLVGLAPAIAVTKPDLVAGLKQGAGAAGSSRRHGRVRSALVVAELALVLVLLCGAAIMGRNFLRLVERPSGYELKGLTLAQLPLSDPRNADSRALGTVTEELRARLEASPDADIALARTFFLRGFGVAQRAIEIEGQPRIEPGSSPSFGFAVSPHFFAAQGLRLTSGRGFDMRDTTAMSPVLIVNQEVADRFWPGRSPLGARVKLPLTETADRAWTVVGVVSNMDGDAARGVRAQAFVYVPLAQLPGRPVDLLIRSQRDLTSLLPRVTSAIAEVNPDEPLTDIRSAAAEHAREYWYVGYFAMFYIAFAAFALLLAVIGVYGVVAQAAAERTREFGIRIALGADRSRLYRLVFRQATMLAVLGVLFGLAGAAATTRLLGWLLFGSSPTDPVLLGGSALVLVAAMFLASALPARRVARLDAVNALKAE